MNTIYNECINTVIKVAHFALFEMKKCIELKHFLMHFFDLIIHNYIKMIGNFTFKVLKTINFLLYYFEKC